MTNKKDSGKEMEDFKKRNRGSPREKGRDNIRILEVEGGRGWGWIE
jgi:hypothetical protein